eukprot:GHVU01048851.1.p1 GENE.GHVU01048851.1~~GHVU01048851.1.p1  ORF type:complete len:251 (+),score=19.02 GHVU01048851.1:167-919(+)
MASVYEVYITLKDLANKDARGMITPSQFNSFASIAQIKVYNDIFKEFESNKRLSLRQATAGRDKNRVKQLQEDLSVFSKSETITTSSTDLGVFTKPDDLARIISMSTFGDWFLDQTTTEAIQIIYDEEKLDLILRSVLSSPTEDTPVALISRDIQVFPTTVRKIKLRYYKTPEGVNPLTGAQVAMLPKFGYTTSAAGQEVYDITNSVDFELPDHYVPQLVLEISKMMGINLRDAEVFQYAQNEEVNKRYE